MKAWWPWRKTKRVLTLFSERVPWQDGTPNGKPPALAPLNRRATLPML
jgi:hypothetical protein